MIDWQAFTWEAFATLSTGVGAVIAALVIGLRQAEIQRRQTKISERQTLILLRQTQLAELTLRKELFEKRHRIYILTYRLLQATRSMPKEEQNEAVREFALAKDQAKFLFRPSVSERLEEIFQKVTHVIMVNQSSGTDFRPDAKHIQLSREYIEWIIRCEASLSDIFGDELQLTDYSTSSDGGS